MLLGQLFPDGQYDEISHRDTHSLVRLCVERTFAWEGRFNRMLFRFEFKQQRHYGMKPMAYTMISLRHFWGAWNPRPTGQTA